MSGSGFTILIIDHDEESIFALRTMFQAQGWNAIAANDAAAGLELMRSESPDLVLIAVQLPGVNGIRGVELMRELDADVPIICVSDNESPDLAARLFAAGASDFTLKPFKAPDILSRIRLHIRLLELSQQLNCKKDAHAHAHKAKGIGSVTLELIQSAFRSNTEYLTVETIAERTGLAYQTTYRYLQHMASQELLEVCQNYGKVGRPKQKYRLKKPCACV